MPPTQASERELRAARDVGHVHGVVCATLWRPFDLLDDPDGVLLGLDYFGGTPHALVRRTVVPNLVTRVGDQVLGEIGFGVTGAPHQVTGMRLGTDATAAAKTGTGASIITYVTGSAVAIDASFPTSALSGSSRRITFQTTWGAGVATSAVTPLAEVVITNEFPLTDVIGTAANTISRALLSPTVLKGAGDTLVVSWAIDILGA